MCDRARATLEELVTADVEYDAIQQLLCKIEGGMGYWLPFIVEPAVEPTNSAAENTLREPVVLQKIIGALRTESGVFAHEKLLSLVATWKQAGRNPYDEFERVATSGTPWFWFSVIFACCRSGAKQVLTSYLGYVRIATLYRG